MRDRIPSEGKAGRVLLTPENGDAPFYAIMEMADEPLEVGTPPTKANLLTDETEAALFGSAADRTVNDAFLGISAQLKLIMSDMASITVTVKDHAGNPVKDVLVASVYSEAGSAVYTNASGVASGYIAEGSQTISVKGYADLSDVSKTITVVKGSTVTETLTPTRTNFVKVTSSKSIKFSGNVSTIDASVVGGGAGGERGSSGYNTGDAVSGPGGSGGYVVNTDGIVVEANKNYSVVIGAGGKGAGKVSSSSASTGGGASSAFGVTANGASASTAGNANGSNPVSGVVGAGNGRGGDSVIYTYGKNSTSGNPGGNGKVAAYSSFTETATWGAGGGSGAVGNSTLVVSGGTGGEVGGGTGGNKSTNSSTNAGGDAIANTGSGGGGGGAIIYSSDSGTVSYAGIGGNGAAGVVTARIHFDFGDLAA